VKISRRSDAIPISVGYVVSGGSKIGALLASCTSWREDEIRKFIAERGVSKCPPKTARELGEASPGWRREVEPKAERTDKGRASPEGAAGSRRLHRRRRGEDQGVVGVSKYRYRSSPAPTR